ncbi:FAD-dependent oxidoreductase [Pelomonas sp. SE-A7]|uniref:FAD-dependent oxidoreductase n=1 Tax=Pelomonas sp. SE-A7 TaxID=3054953 RepID=UPI00259C7053|nr:FAD-dependent oxidoreductase [Pelomonas sp. SE-A7]MDM4766756.1 FAD-dependent oxidoreductase [Pelomonas sp. SE-A7]
MSRKLQADAVVVGAGPAGIAAVRTLVHAGRSVIWIDKQPRAGGQIWRGGPPPAWARELQAMEASPRLTRLASHAVIAAEAGRELLLHDQAQGLALRVQAPQWLLATGARERLLPIPGWTLPGVTGAGGLQALVKNGWPIAGQRVVLAGSGPLLLATADTLKAKGAEILALVEQAPRAALARFALGLPVGKAVQALGLRRRLRGIPYLTGTWVTAAHGEGRLQSISLSDGRTLACDALGLGFGLLPSSELAALLGCRLDADGTIEVDARQQTSLPGIYAAGECTGIGGVDKSLIEGERAAREMLGQQPGLARAHKAALSFGRSLARHFALRPELLKLADAKTTICRCEDVRLGALRGAASWREAKLQTRCGMGACQGRICGGIARELMGWSDAPGRPRIPLEPAPLQVLLDGAAGCAQSPHDS